MNEYLEAFRLVLLAGRALTSVLDTEYLFAHQE